MKVNVKGGCRKKILEKSYMAGPLGLTDPTIWHDLRQLLFRRRRYLRFYLCRDLPFLSAALGLQFENNCEVGVFSKLTNAYCLVAIGGSESFYSVFEAELADVIPVVKTSIGGTRIIGRLCAGNETRMGFSCPIPPQIKALDFLSSQTEIHPIDSGNEICQTVTQHLIDDSGGC
ncbi:hypothetical protein V8G54_013039 [Vigna mungo]|uniref:Uncharacterized protein n=1 Tax=Vigna mungo TaxID=3915 RepID=A0AAQ3NW30_VIGMU